MERKQISIAVVLAYFNGEDYIKEQVNSILNQTIECTNLYISDDNSIKKLKKTDLNLENKKSHRVHIYNRKKNYNYSKNFLLTLHEIPNKYNFYSFSDQDDIWFEDKLEKAIEKITEYPEETPVLYCGRSLIEYQGKKHIKKLSTLHSKKPSFSNSLVQNIGGGNTMVMNRAAKKIVVDSFSIEKVISHDWWIYQVLTSCGGIVIYDPKPYLIYRQHKNNLISTNNNWRGRLNRIMGLLKGNYKDWNSMNIKALEKNSKLITNENKKLLSFFIKSRKGNFLKRLYYLKLSRVYRQNLLGNLGLIFGSLINKI